MIRRRQVLMAAGAGAVAGARPGMARAAGGLTLVVAGPAGEQTSRWAAACALALAPGFATAPMISTVPVGGLDGVTGANRLDALVVPDGRTAAILPGDALIAWLAGDPRVHFDPTRWVPVMAALGAGVLVVRLADKQPPTLAALHAKVQASGPLRLAADQPQSKDLAVLLALGRLGITTTPIFGLRDVQEKSNAFLAGDADAVFLSGEGVPADLAALMAAGGVPCFRLGDAGPDDVLAGVPDVTSFAAGALPALGDAYAAVALASRLDFILVLPRLTDPAQATAWQDAAAGAIQSPALMAAATASAVNLVDTGQARAALATMRLAQAEQPGLQAYLAKNFGWQPG